MEAEIDIKREVTELKDFNGRNFNYLTQNFYIMRSALRYFSRRKAVYFTSSKIADNFPVSVPVAASCLNALEELGVVEARKKSSSPDRYVPQEVDLDRLEEVQKILLENHEILEFN